MVVVDGLAVTLAPVVALNPVAGDHEKVGAPKLVVAVSPTDPPLQNIVDDGVTFTTRLPQSAAMNCPYVVVFESVVPLI